MKLINPIKYYKQLHHSKQRNIVGFLFVLPWVIGFFLIFIRPLIYTVIYSFQEIKLVQGGLSKSWVMFENFNYIFRVVPNFQRTFFTSIQKTLIELPTIVIFSMLIAVLLNTNFKFRGVARTIFFLPIIFGLDIYTKFQTGSSLTEIGVEQVGSSNFLNVSEFFTFLNNAGIPSGITMFIGNSINQVFEIISYSAVQILIFLSGLQSISSTLYEVAWIEGATKYETFWKVTIPMISPIIVTVSVYTIVESMYRSAVLEAAREMAFTTGNYGASAAISVCYIISIVIILGILIKLLSKVVFYYE
ncbi:carbohydrate ABC transporter permease [Turicibacter sanguinis]|uniref:carbohydrate ABC transporter permease n=1 Tax=Turicibacter sanguinis TaxID=154288 RepID=UPI00325BC324